MHAQTPAAIEPNPDLDPLKPSPQQVHAAHLLASGSAIEEVCTKLNVGRTTLYRWRQLPSFAAYLNQLTRQYADQALTQSTCLLASAMHLLQQKLADPQTPIEMQLKIAFRIIALYSRPSYLRFLHTLPDDPASVEEQQMRQAMVTVGLPADTTLDGSDVELFRGYQHDFLQKAQAFDARFPSTPSTPPSTAAVMPQRTKMEQNGTSGAKEKCAIAIDAALAGTRHQIATAAA
jgi:hypothetical protein